MRAALTVAAGWVGLACVFGTAWAAWRAALRRREAGTEVVGDGFVAGLEAVAEARAERAVLDELEAWWAAPAVGERRP